MYFPVWLSYTIKSIKTHNKLILDHSPKRLPQGLHRASRLQNQHLRVASIEGCLPRYPSSAPGRFFFAASNWREVWYATNMVVQIFSHEVRYYSFFFFFWWGVGGKWWNYVLRWGVRLFFGWCVEVKWGSWMEKLFLKKNVAADGYTDQQASCRAAWPARHRFLPHHHPPQMTMISTDSDISQKYMPSTTV